MQENIQDKDILSYGYLIKCMNSFKASGGSYSNEFNTFDTPGHLFFKPIFYFQNGDSSRPDNDLNSGGLLAPTWLNNIKDDEYYLYNSAWSYLKLNGEDTRADSMKKFIELLSNINTYSPWYFQSIEGISEARTRAVEGGVKVDENRKKITIKCLQDSYDDRIGTLLDLYREVTWSWVQKREIIPANLRKFDMGIYIFSSPITNMHDPSNKMDYKLTSQNSNIHQSIKDLQTKLNDVDQYASVNKRSSNYITSYKYIEFHNCEISYDATSTGFENLDNIEGTLPVYSIDIYYDDCYEERYNEFMYDFIGDMIETDLFILTNPSVIKKSKPDVLSVSSDLKTKGLHSRTSLYDDSIQGDSHQEENVFGKRKRGRIGFLGEVIGAIKDRAQEFFTQKFLGNLHGFSLEKGITDIRNLSQGKVFATVNAVKGAVRNAKADDIQEFIPTNIKGPTQNKKFYIEKSNIFKNKTVGSNI